ncbi:lipid-binding SYLF domain-containing protein [Photobacterium leiognathi]|uniref:lipid-binding SYLF domain-containing protein n=1 Tax=Photobacterium leiognathi TaxID=553611 RepID=UPI0027373019|nr:lipid-binding SYLF domain-containing protein [Photobacterium leiognathi]
MKTIHKLFIALCTCIMMLSSTSALAQDSDTQKALDLFYQSPQTQPFFKSAYGYAVFPSVGKGGFWVGGAYGNGVVFKANQATGFAKLFQVSIGLQFGGQAYSEILFFQDKRAYDNFVSGSFELDAQASAVALDEGASAKAGTAGAGAGSNGEYATRSYINGVAIFTKAKGGAMIEASLAGQKFTFEPMTEATRNVKGYDKMVPQGLQKAAQEAKTVKPAETIKTPAEENAVVVETLERPDDI